MTGPQPDEWRDRVALVTGGSGDIGAAVVTALLERGARVASADVRPWGGAPHPALRADVVDLTDPAASAAWVDEVTAAIGVPEIVVLSTGFSGDERLVDTTPERWRAVLDACLDAVAYTAIPAIRAMIAAGAEGRLVAIGSWAADSPHPHIGSYTVAKAGLRALVRTLALDHAADGILVNEVAPGIVEAGLSRELMAADAALARRVRAAIPVDRTLTPDDVVRDVLHLASPRNRHTTGATLVSDGGLSLASIMNPGRRDG